MNYLTKEKVQDINLIKEIIAKAGYKGEVRALVGIIDFANAVVEPKYLDFFPLYKINRNLAVEVIKRYNEQVEDKIDIKQTDFIMLSYIAYNLAKTDNPPPYFMKLLKLF